MEAASGIDYELRDFESILALEAVDSLLPRREEGVLEDRSDGSSCGDDRQTLDGEASTTPAAMGHGGGCAATPPHNEKLLRASSKRPSAAPSTSSSASGVDSAEPKKKAKVLALVLLVLCVLYCSLTQLSPCRLPAVCFLAFLMYCSKARR